MEQIIFRPKLYKFDTLKAFTDEFKVGGSDLILTNKYIRSEEHTSELQSR